MHQDQLYRFGHYIDTPDMSLRFDVDFQSIQVHRYHNVHQYILRYIHRSVYWFQRGHRFGSQVVVLKFIDKKSKEIIEEI